AGTDGYKSGTATGHFDIKQKMHVTLTRTEASAIISTKVLTNVDDITLSVDSTDLIYAGNGLFRTESLTVGEHTVKVAVGENNPDLLQGEKHTR
ncbi:MAG: hypothetical protein ACI4PK_03300, partial [Oscillospiraceae bacterium]